MKTKALIAVAAFGAAAFSLPATAQMSMSSAYVGGGFGQSKFSDGCQGASGAGGSAEAKATAWELDAVGSFPVWQQLSILGRLGLYYGEGKIDVPGASGKKNTTDLTYGLGVGWDFNKNLGVRGEWQRYSKV